MIMIYLVIHIIFMILFIYIENFLVFDAVKSPQLNSVIFNHITVILLVIMIAIDTFSNKYQQTTNFVNLFYDYMENFP